MIKKSSTKDLSLSSNERLFFEAESIFHPKKYQNFIPKGLEIYTFNAGFKKKLHDLLVIIFTDKVNSYKVFSKTSTPSSPIIWAKKNNGHKTKALIINAGNANAHTGSKGISIINNYTSYLAKIIGCKKSEIAVSSTGVIGEIFDPNLINNQLIKIKETENTDLLNAAISIMTTDTYPKIVVKKVMIGKKAFKIFGIAKGSGMIMPNMGTMLAYIFIEAKLPLNIMRRLINKHLDNTFNSISVDGDTSTSDTLMCFSLNEKNINFKNINNFKILDESLKNLMMELSLKVIKDGEGCTKLIKVKVDQARTKTQAKNIAFSIINSPLVKTAISGEDANWGRVIMAVGKSKERINQNKLKIYFGKILVSINGKKNRNIKSYKLDNYMKKKIIEINVFLQNGNYQHTVFGNDLSHDYIRINADYRS